MKSSFDMDKLATCLGALANMNGGELVIPKNERDLIDGRALSVDYNPHTGTVTIRLAPQPESDWGESDV